MGMLKNMEIENSEILAILTYLQDYDENLPGFVRGMLTADGTYSDAQKKAFWEWHSRNQTTIDSMIRDTQCKEAIRRDDERERRQ